MNTALIAIGFLLVAVAGFFVGRWDGMSRRSKELSEELEQKDEELTNLKQNVDEHFDETARLFTNLTEEYKSLYQHLAKGANNLSNKAFKLSLAATTNEAIEQQTTVEADAEAAGESPVQPVDYAKPDQTSAEDPTIDDDTSLANNETETGEPAEVQGESELAETDNNSTESEKS